MNHRYTVIMFVVNDQGSDEMRRVIQIAMELVNNGEFKCIVAGQSYYYQEQDGRLMLAIQFENN